MLNRPAKPFKSIVYSRGSPWVFICIGVFFAAFGLFSGHSLNRFIAESIDAEVTVVRIEEKTEDRRSVYRPVLEVSDQGRQVRYADDYWTAPPLHVVGEVLDGRYDRAGGKIMSIRSIESLRSFSDTFRNIGLLTFAIGAVWLWPRRRGGGAAT